MIRKPVFWSEASHGRGTRAPMVEMGVPSLALRKGACDFQEALHFSEPLLQLKGRRGSPGKVVQGGTRWCRKLVLPQTYSLTGDSTAKARAESPWLGNDTECGGTALRGSGLQAGDRGQESSWDSARSLPEGREGTELGEAVSADRSVGEAARTRTRRAEWAHMAALLALLDRSPSRGKDRRLAWRGRGMPVSHGTAAQKQNFSPQMSLQM